MRHSTRRRGDDIPLLTREPISLLAGLLGSLGGHADRNAVGALARFGTHADHRAENCQRKAARVWGPIAPMHRASWVWTKTCLSQHVL
jgi:hypothetical protein